MARLAYPSEDPGSADDDGERPVDDGCFEQGVGASCFAQDHGTERLPPPGERFVDGRTERVEGGNDAIAVERKRLGAHALEGERTIGEVLFG